MMFTCTTPGCTDLAHGHRFGAARSVAAARARKRSISSKLVRDKKKGRSLRIDIHCHYLNRDAAAKLAHLNPAQYEPSEGLAPLIVAEVGRTLLRLKREGQSILLVEQNIKLALDLADEVVILNTGRVAFSGSAGQMRNDQALITQHLGVF